MLKIIKLSAVIFGNKFSEPVIELAPLFIDLTFGEPIGVENALIHIHFEFFAFLYNRQEIFLEEELPGVFTCPTEILLVQRERAVFFLEIRVVWLGHGPNAKSTGDLLAKFLTHFKVKNYNNHF
jgi:hypothetical protein